MVISVIADSLALPRNEGEDIVKIHEVWPYVLKAKYENVFGGLLLLNYGKRSRTMDTLLGVDYHECITLVQPDLIIVQIGVVDGLPRIISKAERRIMNSRFFPSSLRSMIIRRRKRLRKKITSKNPLSKVWLKPDRFSACQIGFLDKVMGEKLNPMVLFIPILLHQEKMEEISPGCRQNVSLYNQILKDNVQRFKDKVFLLSENSFYEGNSVSELFCSDGYHLSVTGNRKLASCIHEMLIKLKEEHKMEYRNIANG